MEDHDKTTNKEKDAKRWPISLPRLDTASKTHSSQPQKSHIVPPHLRQSIRDKAHVHRQLAAHRGARTRTRDSIQSPFEYNPLRAAFGSVAFGSSKQDISQSPAAQTTQDSKPNSLNNLQINEPPPTTQSDIDHERQNRGPRERHLASALHNLLATAQDATRRLDDTFYELLSKTTDLTTHLTLLRKLDESTVTTRTHLEQQTSHCATDLETTLKRYNDFAAQRDTIRDLHARLQDRRDKSKSLETRLAAVGDRLAKFEKRETESQQSRAATRKAVAGSLGAVALLLIVLLVWVRLHRARHHLLGPAGEQQTSAGHARVYADDKQFTDRLRALDEL